MTQQTETLKDIFGLLEGHTPRQLLNRSQRDWDAWKVVMDATSVADSNEPLTEDARAWLQEALATITEVLNVNE